MKKLPSCILYSRDEDLIGRLLRISSSITGIQPIEAQSDLEQCFSQFGDTLLLADLRAPNCLEVLSEIKANWPLSVIVILGVDRSDPMLTAEWLDPFATIGLEPDRREFQALLKQAPECFALRKRSQLLDNELTKLQAQKIEPAPQLRTLFSAPLQNFSKAQKNFDNLDLLFDSVVEGLVATARVSRAGIFIKPDPETHYTFQSGMRCLQATEKLSVPGNSPFVRWMEMNTHLVSRQTLENIPDPEERAMLKQMLDSLGAEIIIPTAPVAQHRLFDRVRGGQRAGREQVRLSQMGQFNRRYCSGHSRVSDRSFRPHHCRTPIHM
ncbi:MAG: hypothetical protein L3J16_06965 [Anaerolineales bacterium]|nr:hypothetical protein [Anaerolineales bacterium]